VGGGRSEEVLAVGGAEETSGPLVLTQKEFKTARAHAWVGGCVCI
jgi:hypothetical protein